MTIHGKDCLAAFVQSADKRNNRRTKDISTTTCVSVMAGMWQCLTFDKWICPTCPIGVVVRCNEVYSSEFPHSTYDDFSDLLLCNWICHRMGVMLPKMRDFLSFLPYIDLPEAVNKDTKVKDKAGYLHRKY